MQVLDGLADRIEDHDIHGSLRAQPSEHSIRTVPAV